MTLQVQWLIDRRIILCQASQALSAEEMKTARARLALLVNVGDAPIHILFDFSEASNPPTTLADYGEWLISHPHLGWCIVIQKPSLKARLTTSLAQIFNGTPLKVYPSLEHALAFLRGVDPSLAQSPPATSAKATTGRL